MPKLPDIGFCNSSHLDLDLGAPAHIIRTVLFTFPSSKECLSRENGGSPSVGFTPKSISEFPLLKEDYSENRSVEMCTCCKEDSKVATLSNNKYRVLDIFAHI